jgi:hypothetical protein
VRQQGFLQRIFQPRHFRRGAGLLGLRQLFHFGVVEHFARRRKVGAGDTVSIKQGDHRRDLGMLARQLALAVHVARGMFAAQQAIELFQALRQLFELVVNAFFHGRR